MKCEITIMWRKFTSLKAASFSDILFLTYLISDKQNKQNWINGVPRDGSLGCKEVENGSHSLCVGTIPPFSWWWNGGKSLENFSQSVAVFEPVYLRTIYLSVLNKSGWAQSNLIPNPHKFDSTRPVTKYVWPDLASDPKKLSMTSCDLRCSDLT